MPLKTSEVISFLMHIKLGNNSLIELARSKSSTANLDLVKLAILHSMKDFRSGEHFPELMSRIFDEDSYEEANGWNATS